MNTYLILAAGGSGTRMQAGQNKIFLPVCGMAVIERSIRLFDGLIDGMFLVCRKNETERIEKLILQSGVSFPVKIVNGGDTRQRSVLNGLKAMNAEQDDIVLVHDAARCITPRSVILDVIRSCRLYGSGIPAVSAVNTMKYCKNGEYVTNTVNRTDLYEIQTPQGFKYAALLKAYRIAEKDSFIATDDASVMEHASEKVRITEGTRTNIKITEKDDLIMAEAVLSSGNAGFRIGMGYDVHRLTDNRKLILCGVEIPYPLGLLGHSDADVALHALMDAMFGAASLGDIGRHFPDDSEIYRGISSCLLLEKTVDIIYKAGYRFVNADITIIAQKPKIASYIPEMIRKISQIIRCNQEQISVKATTTERLGFEGREEGISAQAVCLLEKTVNTN